MIERMDVTTHGRNSWKVRCVHHDACTHVRVLGHQDNMRDNKGDNPAGPADYC
jgi:hypothetical protein